MSKLQEGDRIKFTHYIESNSEFARKPFVITKTGKVMAYSYKGTPQFPSHVRSPDEVLHVQGDDGNRYMVLPTDAIKI